MPKNFHERLTLCSDSSARRLLQAAHGHPRKSPEPLLRLGSLRMPKQPKTPHLCAKVGQDGHTGVPRLWGPLRFVWQDRYQKGWLLPAGGSRNAHVAGGAQGAHLETSAPFLSSAERPHMKHELASMSPKHPLDLRPLATFSVPACNKLPAQRAQPWVHCIFDPHGESHAHAHGL